MDVYELSETITPEVISRGIDDYHQLTTVGFILLFQLGFIIYEYGTVRQKNASSVLIRSLVVFLFSCWGTYSFGFAFAYGKTYVIGEKYYFTSFNMDDNTSERNEIKWSLHFAVCSLTAQMATSGLQERSRLMIPMLFALLISIIIFPFVVGWTLGLGFMYKLGLVDETGCCSIHLTAGFCSLFAAAVAKSRLGRFNLLALKKFYSDKDKNQIVLYNAQKAWIQNKITQIADDIQAGLNKKNLEQTLIKARKIIKRADKDNFFTPNNEIFTFIGTLIMWFSLCHLQSGYNLHVYDQRYQVELAYINCLVAGASGGISALLMKIALSKQYIKKARSYNKNSNLYDYTLQIINPLTKYDTIVICRGIIAGCVIVSAPGIYYKIWISFILGFVAGAVYVVSSVIVNKLKIDDPMQVFQTHGVPAILSLILIVCFQQEVGIFFTEPNDIITQDKLKQIIKVFGANILGCFLIIGWCGLFTIPFLSILSMCLRVGRVTEILGMDASLELLGRKELQNFTQYIINEYYPENSGLYMRKKNKLIEQEKETRRKGRKLLSKKEIKAIYLLLEEEIKLAFAQQNQTPDQDQDPLQEGEPELNQSPQKFKAKTFEEEMMEVDEIALQKMYSKNQTQKSKIYDAVDSKVIDKKGVYSQVHNLPTEERKDDGQVNYFDSGKRKSPDMHKSPSQFMKSPSFQHVEENFYPDSHNDDDSHEGEVTMRSEVTVEVEDDAEFERRSLTQKAQMQQQQQSNSRPSSFVQRMGNAIKQRVGLVNNFVMKMDDTDSSVDDVVIRRKGAGSRMNESSGPMRQFK